MRRIDLPEGGHLTDMEVRILRLMFEGHRARSAAEVLGCSERNVEGHLRHVYRKLDTHSLTQTLRRLRELGLIDQILFEEGES